MWIAAWLITTNDLRIDLLFTMSDNSCFSESISDREKAKHGYMNEQFSGAELDVVRFRPFHSLRLGGARRNRTDDLLLAKQALSQLSYGPVSQ